MVGEGVMSDHPSILQGGMMPNGCLTTSDWDPTRCVTSIFCPDKQIDGLIMKHWDSVQHKRCSTH